MSKIKLETLIKQLTNIKNAYEEHYGKKPYIWNIELDGINAIAEISLSSSMRKTIYGYTAKETTEFELADYE